MAASATESEQDSSLDYFRMEDAFPTGKREGVAQNDPPISGIGVTGERESSVRTAGPVLTPQSETRDIVAPLPCTSPKSPSHARSETPQGILRQGSANSSPGSPVTMNCRKKQVSIRLPERARPRHEHSGTDGDSSSDDGTRQEETIVEVEVEEEEEEEEEEGEEEDHSSAAKTLNPNLPEDSEMEPDVVLLSPPNVRTRKHSRRSTAQSWRSSLSQSISHFRRNPRKPPKLQRLQSNLDLDGLARNELELKASLYWHIGTPVKRWKVERHVPVKLLLQLLKTFCLIVQVILFTFTIPHKRAEFLFDSRIVFESLFLVNFDPGAPLQEQIAYSIQDVSRELEFIVANYYQIPNITIGGYDFVRDASGQPVPLHLRLRQYRQADLYASDSTFTLDGVVEEITFNYSLPSEVSVTQRLAEESRDPIFHKFIDLDVSFPVNIIRIEAPQKAECYRFTVQVIFQNDDHNGKILYSLKESFRRLHCDGTVLADKTEYYAILVALVSLDLIVLSLCFVSVFLTAKTLFRAYRLGKAMGKFYHDELHLPLTWWERRSLFSVWHFFNITSDIFILVGTIYKILLEFEVVIDASPARVLLGSALLFQAGVILRYINYFKQLNTLTRTLAVAFPELLKFLLCGSVLFLAFALCGWIVLGPFHPKFTTFISSVESLFGLLNGDDIYNTYIQINEQVDILAYVYSRIFLYLFLALFIYAVLNLFTSLIIAAYEISQNKDTSVKNEVRRFVFSGPLTPRGVALRDVTSTSKYVDPKLILNKGQKKLNNIPSDDDE